VSIEQLQAENERLRAEVERLRGGGEAVAYAVFSGNGNIRIWCADPVQVETLEAEFGSSLTPLYTHPAPAVPDGFKLVPVEPTDQQQEVAAFNLCGKYGATAVENAKWFALDVYRELVAAAPQPEEK
jgi:hypothetical protein